MSMLTAKEFEKLQKALDEYADLAQAQQVMWKELGIKFRGTLAEACILSSGARDVVETNVLIRSQLARVEQELSTLDSHLRAMVWSLMANIQETANG